MGSKQTTKTGFDRIVTIEADRLSYWQTGAWHFRYAALPGLNL